MVVEGEANAISWPPRDPNDERRHNRPFQLPSSPWTYENGSVNPNLRPSNDSLRQRSGQRVSSVPPYHPDYRGSADDDSDEYDDNVEAPLNRKRLGSEGYEVQPIDREKLLAQFILDQAAQDGRYVAYEPEPHSESEIDN